MSNEFSISTSVACTNGAYTNTITASGAFNQSTQGAFSNVVSVPTSDTAVTITVGTLGFVFLKNLDTTNYITYGPDNSGAIVNFGRIKPGESHLFRFEPGITLRAKSHTAACLLYYVVFND